MGASPRVKPVEIGARGGILGFLLGMFDHQQ
jgi:hypothetical protein